jgi:uncharacterized protein (TIGR02284 family)
MANAASITPNHLTATLGALASTAADSQRGYAAAAATAKNTELVALFQKRAGERAAAADDLARVLGTSPPANDSLLQRGLLDRRAEGAAAGDRQLLEERERADRASLRAYEEALRHVAADTLPEGIRRTVERHMAQLRTSLKETWRRLSNQEGFRC